MSSFNLSFMSTKSSKKEMNRSKGVACLILLAIITSLLVFAAPSISSATIYYIDYQYGSDGNNGTSKSTPWQLCPGMVGFAASYTHQPGDKFIFKGGVTWPSTTLPLTISYSGNFSARDEYTVDKSWYIGSSWSYPVFDGGGSVKGIYSLAKQYFIIDSLKICNNGNGVLSGDYGIVMASPYYVSVRNCYIQPNAVTALGFAVGNSGNQGKVEVYNNTIKSALKLFTYGGSTITIADDVKIYNNIFNGSTVSEIGGYHTNGIHMFGYGPDTSPVHSTGRSFTNLKIFNNKFNGDWSYGATAHIYLADGFDGVEIYNNEIGFDNTTSAYATYMFSPGAIAIRKTINLKIYSNTISSAGMYDLNKGIKAGIVLGENVAFADVKNNIIYYTEFGIQFGSTCTSCTSDYNLIYIRPSGGVIGTAGNPQNWYRTLSTWQAAGYDIHGKSANPLFVNAITSPYNLSLQTSSPALSAGLNLGSNYSTDLMGNVRPVTGNWAMGAYESMISLIEPVSPAVTSTSLSAPSKFRVTHNKKSH